MRVCDDCKRLESAASTAGGTAGVHVSQVVSDALTRIAAGSHGPVATTATHTADSAHGDSATTTTTAALRQHGASGPVEPEARLGIGIFDRRTRLAPPSGEMFNAPASSAAEDLFRSLATVAEEHLEWIVRRAVSEYIPERPSIVADSAVAGVAAAAAEAGARLGKRQEMWVNALTRAARRAAATIDPNIRDGDRSDPRLYLKVKAIPLAPPATISVGDATAEESSATQPADRQLTPYCEVIDGVVFRRNLPHKGMRSDILSPRVVLLDGE